MEQPTETNWRYCSLQQDPSTGKLFMLVHNGYAWTFGYEVTQLIDVEAEVMGVVS